MLGFLLTVGNLAAIFHLKDTPLSSCSCCLLPTDPQLEAALAVVYLFA